MTVEQHERHMTAPEIVAQLPTGEYTRYYQPTYQDLEQLTAAVGELLETQPVTTPARIGAARHGLERTTLAGGSVAVTGSCNEPVDLAMPIDTIVGGVLDGVKLVDEETRGALHFVRSSMQAVKPRSNPQEILADGRVVPPYMGDAINGRDPDHRTPDPSRLVAAALQARDVASMVRRVPGVRTTFFAHEALSVAYERAFMHVDAEGRSYLLSADMPWIGARTNRLEDNPHLDLLTGIENPVGVKLGADSDQEHIAGLAERLNPARELGKLVFMVRVGGDEDAMRRILGGIAEHAPESVLMYDVHGSTTVRGKDKIRAVPTMVEHITSLSRTAGKYGLRMHGVHLETMNDDSRLECVDAPDQLPTHPGNVDPQLNPRQTRTVLRAIRPLLT